MSEMPLNASQQPATSPATGRRRAAALAGQVAGGAGLVVSLVLIVLVLIGRGWVVGTIDDVEASINAALGRATPVVVTAQGLVTEVGDKVGELASAADAVATDTAAPIAALAPLQQRLATLNGRYLALREAYAGLRADVVSAADRLAMVGRVVPGVSVPEGPANALMAFDERMRGLDQRVMGLIAADAAENAVDQKAAAIATAARDVESSIADVSTAIGTVNTKVAELQAQVATTASNVRTLVTLVTVVLVLLLLYIAFLNLVLFRVSVLYGEPAAAA